MLTLGWSDGNSFLPVSHSLLSAAEDKNLICGGKQYDGRSLAGRRRLQSRRKATEVMVELIHSAQCAGITAKYILFDSWFSAPKTILELKKQERLDTIAMMKKSKTKYGYQGERLNVKEIYSRNKKRRGSCLVTAHRKNYTKEKFTMNNLQKHMENYLNYCAAQKCLDEKTLKAYRIDLRQFSEQTVVENPSEITSDILEKYITILHQQYKPRTAKRKIASIKALFHYFEYKEIIDRNPFNKIQIRFREPMILPKTIPLRTVEAFLATIYQQKKYAKTDYQKRNALRDAAVVELPKGHAVACR